MFRIAPRHPRASGKAANELAAGLAEGIEAPAMLRLLAASPGLFAAKAEVLRYYAEHPRLGFELLAAIRHLAARSLGATDCEEDSLRALLACGLSRRAIADLPEQGEAFFDAEAALLRFVCKAMRGPGRITDRDIAALRALGWDDATVLDALAHAADVHGTELLVAALKR